ncbi:hypothetical protein HZS_2142 [Henneguya salminicola]|nr:hypothetical protein HZS_2142 [Henneguya salminicola]
MSNKDHLGVVNGIEIFEIDKADMKKSDCFDESLNGCNYNYIRLNNCVECLEKLKKRNIDTNYRYFYVKSTNSSRAFILINGSIGTDWYVNW